MSPPDDSGPPPGRRAPAPAETAPVAPASPSGRPLKIIGQKPLAAVMDLAVSRVLRRRMRRYEAPLVAAVQEEIRQEFSALLKENSRAVRGVSKRRFLVELERSRDEVLAARDAARAELGELLKRLDFFSSLQQADERAQRRGARSFDEVHRPDLARRVADLLARAERGELAPAELRELLVGLAARSVEEDRRRIHDERAAEHGRLVETFERRIAKLNQALAASEEALAALAKQKGIDPGLASIYRTVQGLPDNEDNRRVKELLLEQVFLANMLLQKKTA
ncbi:MAG: hypothetical protein AB1726_14010 [Planctomycetota bacterium]